MPAMAVYQQRIKLMTRRHRQPATSGRLATVERDQYTRPAYRSYTYLDNCLRRAERNSLKERQLSHIPGNYFVAVTNNVSVPDAFRGTFQCN